MSVIKADQITACEIPDNLHDSVVIRCIKHEFTESKSSKQPMIVSTWEIVGIKGKDGTVEDHMIVGGKKYVIAGIQLRPVYHSLSQKALRRHQEFWAKANGKTEKEYEVDTENPERSYYNNLVMSAVVKAVLMPRTKKLSEEEQADLKSQGLPYENIPVVDDEGKPLPPFKMAEVDVFNRRFSGELPQF